MSTPKEAAQMLLTAHARIGSWRKLSALLNIPAGTLSRIAKSEGAYIPKAKRYRLVLGVSAQHQPRHGKTIQTMSKKELVYLFEHRLEM